MENEFDPKVVADALVKLAMWQAVELKADVVKYTRDKKEEIAICVNEVKIDLESKAKAFGIKMNGIATELNGKRMMVTGILDNYKDTLEKATKPFDEEMKDVVAKQIGLQTEFISLAGFFVSQELAQEQRKSIMANNQNKNIAKAVLKYISEENYGKAVENVEKLQEATEDNQPEAVKTLAKSNLEQMKAKLNLINECKREKKGIKERREAVINQVKADKKMELAVQTKSIVTKIVKSLFNKFNGTKKFVKTSLDPLKNTITNIVDTHIPNIKKGVADRIEKFSDSFENKKSDWEKAVSEKVEQYAEKLAETKEGVLRNLKGIKEQLRDGVIDAVETAQIEGLIAKDYIHGNLETAQILGMEAKDKVSEKIGKTKDWVADKVETAQIIGMVAKDAVIARKDAIIEGAVGIKNNVYDKANDVKEGANKFITNTREGAAKIATDVKDGVVNVAKSAKSLIVKGINTVGDAGKSTYKALIDRGYQMQINLLKKLEQKQSKVQSKMQQLDSDLYKQDKEPDFI